MTIMMILLRIRKHRKILTLSELLMKTKICPTSFDYRLLLTSFPYLLGHWNELEMCQDRCHIIIGVIMSIILHSHRQRKISLSNPQDLPPFRVEKSLLCYSPFEHVVQGTVDGMVNFLVVSVSSWALIEASYCSW